MVWMVVLTTMTTKLSLADGFMHISRMQALTMHVHMPPAEASARLDAIQRNTFGNVPGATAALKWIATK